MCEDRTLRGFFCWDDIEMEDSKPTPTHFAASDTSASNDLKSRIVACLTSRIPNLRSVHVTVFGGTAVLRGTLSSAHEKRLCLECCRHVPGVSRAIDDLTVAYDKPVYFDPDENDSL
jgi:osmotically-inducible protein OsmY